MADQKGISDGCTSPTLTANFPQPKIKIEMVQPDTEVDFGGDFIHDRNNCKETLPHEEQKVPNEMTLKDVTTERIVADHDGDSKSGPASRLKQGRHPCSDCNQCFGSEGALNDHVLRGCGKELEIECTHCPFRTEYMDDIRSHITLKHKDIKNPNFIYRNKPPLEPIERPTCTGCGKSYKNKECLKKHMKYCEKSNGQIVKHICQLCNFETKWKRHLTRHHRRVHSAEDIERPTCTGCGKSYKHQESLEQHMTFCEKTNNGIVKHNCSICSYETKWKAQLTRHLIQMHPPGAMERPTCLKCGKSYKNKDSLKKHTMYCEKSNNEIVQYKCKLCDFETKWKSHLPRHLRLVHLTHDRPTCPQCEKTYKNDDSLKIHMKYCEKSKNEVFKFKCLLCHHETKRKDSLKRHIQTMHPVEVTERLTCAGCGKSYKNYDSLRYHIRYCELSNDEVIKYKCFHCPLENKRKDILRKHIEMHHLAGEIELQFRSNAEYLKRATEV